MRSGREQGARSCLRGRRGTFARLPRPRSPALTTVTGLVLAALVLLACSCGQSVKRIGVFQFGPDADTESAYRGLVAGLADRGYTLGENLRIDRRDCGGDQALIDGTARDFAAAGLDAVVPLTTPCLVAAAKYVKDTPVVFTSVYDPMAAGVAESPGHHPSNLTGVYTPPPVEQTIDLIAECLPGIVVIGTVYNPSEANSRAAVKRMEASCAAQGMRLAKLAVKRPEDVKPALEGFLGGRPQAGGPGNPQALYITGDNTVMGAFADVVAVTRQDGMPLFINDPGFVEQGAVAGVGPDFAQAGRSGGRLLAAVLGGKDPAAMPLQKDSDTLLYVNTAAAAAAGVQVPQAVLERAARVF